MGGGGVKRLPLPSAPSLFSVGVLFLLPTGGPFSGVALCGLLVEVRRIFFQILLWWWCAFWLGEISGTSHLAASDAISRLAVFEVWFCFDGGVVFVFSGCKGCFEFVLLVLVGRFLGGESASPFKGFELWFLSDLLRSLVFRGCVDVSVGLGFFVLYVAFCSYCLFCVLVSSKIWW